MSAQRAMAGAATAMLLAVLLWATPASSGLPPATEGDADCDGETTSRDAAVILQADAGLIDTVPCPRPADVNLDGAINSRDAAIVLQMEAGLCCDEPLTAELSIDSLSDSLSFSVPYRDPLPMTLSITNGSDTQIERTYSSGQRYDIFAFDLMGSLVWRWSHDLSFIQVIMQETFAPGEKVTYSVVWNQQTNDGEQVEPGTYTLRGIDVGCGMPPGRQCNLGASSTFEILPPTQ